MFSVHDLYHGSRPIKQAKVIGFDARTDASQISIRQWYSDHPGAALSRGLCADKFPLACFCDARVSLEKWID